MKNNKTDVSEVLTITSHLLETAANLAVDINGKNCGKFNEPYLIESAWADFTNLVIAADTTPVNDTLGEAETKANPLDSLNRYLALIVAQVAEYLRDLDRNKFYSDDHARPDFSWNLGKLRHALEAISALYIAAWERKVSEAQDSLKRLKASGEIKL